jgi:hypothetical protein
MEEQMKEALVECCKKHGETLTEGVVEFAYDLINTAINVSENKIDDAFLPVINATKPIVLSYVDKIDGEVA